MLDPWLGLAHQEKTVLRPKRVLAFVGMEMKLHLFRFDFSKPTLRPQTQLREQQELAAISRESSPWHLTPELSRAESGAVLG